MAHAATPQYGRARVKALDDFRFGVITILLAVEGILEGQSVEFVLLT